MSHLFDLTGPSFAALRLPAALAALAFALGPAIAWLLRAKRRHLAATTAIALTSAVFLIAAHIALIRFAPMLSSQRLRRKDPATRRRPTPSPADNQVLLYGDQSYGSSIPFYLGRPASVRLPRRRPLLLHALRLHLPRRPRHLPHHDRTPKDWGTGKRKILFVPLEKRDDVDRLLGKNKILLEETSGKALFTDRPLDTSAPNPPHP